jgi:hypothetical protein
VGGILEKETMKGGLHSATNRCARQLGENGPARPCYSQTGKVSRVYALRAGIFLE